MQNHLHFFGSGGDTEIYCGGDYTGWYGWVYCINIENNKKVLSVNDKANNTKNLTALTVGVDVLYPFTPLKIEQISGSSKGRIIATFTTEYWTQNTLPWEG